MSDESKRARLAMSDALVDRLNEIARAEGFSMEEAGEMCLLAGLELYERRAVDRSAGLERITRDLEEIRTCLHVLGPAALGTSLLLIYWATTTGSLKVTADELTDEYKTAAQMEWALEMTKRGIVPFLAEGAETSAAATARDSQ